MKLQQVRDAFESRIAFLEREITYFQGKLILVGQAQRIAGALTGDAASSASASATVSSISPAVERSVEPIPEFAVDREPTAQFERQTFGGAAAPEAPEAPAPEFETDQTVNQFSSASHAHAANEAASSASGSAAQPAPEAVEQPAPETADQSAATVVADAGLGDQSHADAHAERILADLEPAVNAAAQANGDAHDDIESHEQAAAEAETEAETSAAASTDEDESEPEEPRSELDTLRSKLASAAAEESTRSPFNALGKFLGRAK